MTKKTTTTKDESEKVTEKVTEAKKNSKKADKMAMKNKAKKAADKMLLDMAADTSTDGKYLLKCAKEEDIIQAEAAKIRMRRKALRAQMKEKKVNLTIFDGCMKMRKMEPEERRMHHAIEAEYTEQLGMDLSPGQKETIAENKKRREDMRKQMSEISGADAGKEIGSGTTAAAEADAPEETKQPAKAAAVPTENKAIGGSFKVVTPHLAAATSLQ